MKEDIDTLFRIVEDLARGIKSLNWILTSRFICLVGPGDSTKSTILDAIEYVLSPRWNLVFEDSDFHNSDCSNEISITATVGELPEVLLTESKFGLQLRGWNFASQQIEAIAEPRFPVAHPGGRSVWR